MITKVYGTDRNKHKVLGYGEEKPFKTETIFRVVVEATENADGTFNFKIAPIQEDEISPVLVLEYSEDKKFGTSVFPKWGPGEGETRETLREVRRTLRKMLSR